MGQTDTGRRRRASSSTVHASEEGVGWLDSPPRGRAEVGEQRCSQGRDPQQPAPPASGSTLPLWGSTAWLPSAQTFTRFLSPATYVISGRSGRCGGCGGSGDPWPRRWLPLGPCAGVGWHRVVLPQQALALAFAHEQHLKATCAPGFGGGSCSSIPCPGRHPGSGGAGAESHLPYQPNTRRPRWSRHLSALLRSPPCNQGVWGRGGPAAELVHHLPASWAPTACATSQ